MSYGSSSGGMGMKKHGTSGRAPKSPKLKHAMKREAEKTSIKATGRIKDPKTSVAELFHGKTK